MSEPRRLREPRTARFEKPADDLLRGVVRDRHEIVFDEPEDLPAGGGTDSHPSPVDYMFASLVGCQISVLNQCLHKARVEDFHISAEAVIDPDSLGEESVAEEMPPHTAKRIRHVDIDLTVEVPEEYAGRAERCLEVYDEGCVVGQSFRSGIEYTPVTHLEVVE